MVIATTTTPMVSRNDIKLNKNICRDINQSLKRNIIHEYTFFEKHEIPYDYIVVDANDTTKYIAGNLYMVLVNLNRIVRKYYKFSSPLYTAYGVMERYKVLSGIINIDGVNVYDMKNYYDDIRIQRTIAKDLTINNKCLKLTELLDKVVEIKSFYKFKIYIIKHFNIKVRCDLIDDCYNFTDETYNVYFNGIDLKKIVNESKKQNFKDVIMNHAVKICDCDNSVAIKV